MIINNLYAMAIKGIERNSGKVKLVLKRHIGKLVTYLTVFAALFALFGMFNPAPALPGEGAFLTWSGDPKTTQAITWLMPGDCTTARVQYLKETDFAGSFEQAVEVEVAGRAFGVSGTDNLFSTNLTGLEPGTSYVYRVGDGENWRRECIFTTARDTGSFCFLYLGDIHAGYEAGWDSHWRDLLASAGALYPGLKFSLQGGDVTDRDNETGYRQLIDAATELFSRIPFMPAMGNHDGCFYLDFFTLPENGPSGLEEIYYSFDYGHARFTVLDSGSNTSVVAAEWLRHELQNSDAVWKFVVFHHPAYYAFADGKTSIYDSIRTNWTPVFEQCGVDLAFVGHQHVYMRTKPLRDGQVQPDGQGVVYVMGVAGTKLYNAGPGYDYIAREVDGASNYQVVNIDGNLLTLTSVQADGQIIDTYQIDKGAAAPGDIEISGVPDVISMNIRDTRLLGVTTKPVDVNMTYSSSDETVAVVDAAGGVIAAVSPGEATVTVTAGKEGYHTVIATCKVVVADDLRPGGGGGGGGSATVSATGGSAKVRPNAGGTVSLGERAAIKIPAGALTGIAAEEVKVTRVTTPPETPADFRLLGDVYEFSVGGANTYTFNKDVTITLIFDLAAISESETPSIYYYDENTDQWIELGGTVTDNTIAVTVDHFTKFAVMAAMEKKVETVEQEDEPTVEVADILTDIDGHWAENSIRNLVTAGAVSGYPDNTFKPENKITRAEFAAILVKAFELKAEGAKIFADTAGHWAEDYIAAAAACGVVSGYDADSFGPDDLITREQMAVLITKAVKLSPVAGEIRYGDSSAVSTWAIDAVAAATENGIMKGYPDNTFQPQGSATRAEAVTVIVNAMR